MRELRLNAEQILKDTIASREERGPDGSAGTLLSPEGLQFWSEIFSNEVFPQLLWNNDSADADITDPTTQDDSYRDSYQDGLADNDPEETWKEPAKSEDSEVGAVWHQDKKFLHLEPIVLAGAALACGGHSLFVSVYDKNKKALIVPSSREWGLDFLNPSAASQKDLIGFLIRVFYDCGQVESDIPELYLAPTILQLEIASIAYGDSTPWMEHCIKEIPMWEEGAPSDFDVIRSNISEDGNVSAFILCAGRNHIPVTDEEAAEINLPDRVDMGAFWSKFGKSQDGMTEMFFYAYFPPTLKDTERTMASLLGLELNGESELEGESEQGEYSDNHADELQAAPASELEHDPELEQELDLTEVEFSPGSQIELFFEKRGFSRITIPDRDVDPLPDAIVRLALDRLDQILPVAFSDSSSISECLYYNAARGEYIVGVPSQYLKNQFKATCDLLFLKCNLETAEPGSHEVTTSFYGISIQPEPFINAALELTDNDPRGSILLPLILRSIDDLPLDSSGQVDAMALNELVCSIGFPDEAQQEEDVSTEIFCLAAFQKSKVEYLVSLKRFEDGGIIIIEDTEDAQDTPSNTGVTLLDSFYKESCTLWADD
jgi:hypothetical protein